MDVATLTDLLREAEEHHGRYEPTAPPHHWSSFYAAYVSPGSRAARPIRPTPTPGSTWLPSCDDQRLRDLGGAAGGGVS